MAGGEPWSDARSPSYTKRQREERWEGARPRYLCRTWHQLQLKVSSEVTHISQL